MTRGSRRVRQGIAALLLTLAAVAGAPAQSPPAAAGGLQPLPPLSARVTDLTGTLSETEQGALEQKLAAFEAAKGAQLAVLIVPTTAPEAIEQYSIRVVEQWKLGRHKVDDGALLIVAKNDRRVRIEVGYGLEGVLTDADSSRIIADTLRPAFRAGQYYGGIDAALGEMMKLIEGEPLPPPTHGRSARDVRGPGALPFILFAALIGSVVLRGMFGHTVGAALTGAGVGLLVLLAGYALLLAGLAALGAFLFALLSGVARRSGWSSYPRGGGLGGGWGGFGGFGGGLGGGGFTGGGGGFGGGGASGSW